MSDTEKMVDNMTATESARQLANDTTRAYIAEYIKKIETGLTTDNCKCEWKDLPNGKKMLSTASLDCPVHTKEGLILGFLEFADGKLFENANEFIKRQDALGQWRQV